MFRRCNQTLPHRGTGFSREGNITDDDEAVDLPALSRLKPVPQSTKFNEQLMTRPHGQSQR
jgi:hypothetical protein